MSDTDQTPPGRGVNIPGRPGDWAFLVAGALVFSPILLIALPAVITGNFGFRGQHRPVGLAWRAAAALGVVWGAFGVWNFVSRHLPVSLSCSNDDVISTVRAIIKDPKNFDGAYVGAIVVISAVRTISKGNILECGAQVDIAGTRNNGQKFVTYRAQESDDGKSIFVQLNFDR